MFCPRCGRAVNENANFCGGCGLSRVEIEKFAAASKVTGESAQQTAANEASDIKNEVPLGTVVNDAAQTQQTAENCCGDAVKETVAQMMNDENPQQTQSQSPKAENEAAKAENETPKAEPAQETPKAEQTAGYTYTAPQGAEYRWSANGTGWQNSAAQPTPNGTAYKPVKNENLSTVDFIWMLLISSIPIVGLIYLIYLAIQDNNTNKRSYARATLIIAAFGVVVSAVFFLGFIIAGL